MPLFGEKILCSLFLVPSYPRIPIRMRRFKLWISRGYFSSIENRGGLEAEKSLLTMTYQNHNTGKKEKKVGEGKEGEREEDKR